MNGVKLEGLWLDEAEEFSKEDYNNLTERRTLMNKWQDIGSAIYMWIILIVFAVLLILGLSMLFARITYTMLYKTQVCEQLYDILEMEQVLGEQKCMECGI